MGDFGDRLGRVDGGDINGDGISDIILGAPRGQESPGQSVSNVHTGLGYVIYGQDTSVTPFVSLLNVSTLNGTNGFTITGFQNQSSGGDEVAVIGDINGDGVDDFALAAPVEDTATQPGFNNGGIYVIYGGGSYGSNFDVTTLTAADGFHLTQASHPDFHTFFGSSISGIGDFNSDGIDDFAVSAPTDGDGMNFHGGFTYVIYGNASGFAADWTVESAMNGTDGFQLQGPSFGNTYGNDIATGDINGDGISDLIMGNRGGDFVGTNSEGQVIVVFGGATMPSDVNPETFTGTEGFTIEGIDFADYTGSTVSASDINNDGFDDIIIGTNEGGESYIVWGSASGHSGSLDLDNMAPGDGFQIDHTALSGTSSFGGAIAAGDVNDDGFGDIALNNNGGTTTIIFGSSSLGVPNLAPFLSVFDTSTHTYIEHDGPTPIDPTMILSDPDDTALTEITVSITAGFDPVNDVLSLIQPLPVLLQGLFTESYNAATGVLTITAVGGSASVSDFNGLMPLITYENLFTTP